jgi:hypothetical protein
VFSIAIPEPNKIMMNASPLIVKYYIMGALEASQNGWE